MTMPDNRSPIGFTVVGVYDGETGDRYAEHFHTATAEDAEALAMEQADAAGATLVIAGTFAGELSAIL